MIVQRNLTTVSLILLNLFLCLTAGAAYAKNMKVFKHVDKNGIIHYSSKKPAGKSFSILNVRCPECSAWRNSVNWNTTPLILNKFTAEISEAAKKHGLQAGLLNAVIHAESAFKHQAISSAGAQGLMQLMPLTQKTYLVTNPYDPAQNINGGAAYLKHLKNTYSSMDVYIAAYNSGETAVERYGKTIPPFPETQEYVRRVKILYSRYQKSLNTLAVSANAPITPYISASSQ